MWSTVFLTKLPPSNATGAKAHALGGRGKANSRSVSPALSVSLQSASASPPPFSLKADESENAAAATATATKLVCFREQCDALSDVAATLSEKYCAVSTATPLATLMNQPALGDNALQVGPLKLQSFANRSLIDTCFNLIDICLIIYPITLIYQLLQLLQPTQCPCNQRPVTHAAIHLSIWSRHVPATSSSMLLKLFAACWGSHRHIINMPNYSG